MCGVHFDCPTPLSLLQILFLPTGGTWQWFMVADRWLFLTSERWLTQGVCLKIIPSLKLTARTWKFVVGRWILFWVGLFSGAMLLYSFRECISFFQEIGPGVQTRSFNHMCTARKNMWLCDRTTINRYYCPPLLFFNITSQQTNQHTFGASQVLVGSFPTFTCRSAESPTFEDTPLLDFTHLCVFARRCCLLFLCMAGGDWRSKIFPCK